MNDGKKPTLGSSALFRGLIDLLLLLTYGCHYGLFDRRPILNFISRQYIGRQTLPLNRQSLLIIYSDMLLITLLI